MNPAPPITRASICDLYLLPTTRNCLPNSRHARGWRRYSSVSRFGGRQAASERVRDEPGLGARDGEAGHVQVLVDGAMGEGDDVVREIPVLAVGVAVVRAHDRDAAAGRDVAVHLGQEGGDRLLPGQMLEEVRHEHEVEVVLGQVGLHDVADDQVDAGVEHTLLVGDLIHRHPLGGGDGVDELAPAGRRVEHALRLAQLLVQVLADRRPDRFAAALVDVAEPEFVEPLVIHSGGTVAIHSSNPACPASSWNMRTVSSEKAPGPCPATAAWPAGRGSS